jgi:hypothetical protein
VVDALHTSIDAAPRRIVREHIYALNSILHPWLLGLLVLHFLLQTSVFVRIRALVLPRS